MFRRNIVNKLNRRALKVMPGGVNSPVRAFKNVGINPVYIKSGKGSKLESVSGKKYIDFVSAWGPMILGHASPMILKALHNQIHQGIGYGATTRIEINFAELIVKMVPGIDKVRMVNSGTEACMTAIRLARAFTGKNKIVKFEGGYHGHADAFLSSAGSGLGNLNIQSVPGVPAVVNEDTLNATYNNIKSVQILFEQYKNEIACIIVEPVAGNMGCVIPEEGFLDGLRTLCNDNNALLILDEVITGFRLAGGGAQEILNIRGDIIAMGKILGAGLPVGAVGARNEIMNMLAPEGKVYQAGTLSGNPLAMSAGYTLVRYLNDNHSVYRNLDEKTKQFLAGVKEILTKKNIPYCINSIGSMFTIYFSDKKVKSFKDAKKCNNTLFKSFYKHLIKNGIFFPPSPYETCFISLAHTDRDLRKTLRVIKKWNGKEEKTDINA